MPAHDLVPPRWYLRPPILYNHIVIRSSGRAEGLQFTSEPADEDAAAVDDLPLYEFGPITTGRLHDSAIQVTIGEGERVHTLVFRR
jgi:hypothetical protein